MKNKPNILILLLFCLSSCASWQAAEVESYRVKRLDLPVNPYGHWMEVKTDAGIQYGELLALESDSLIMIDTADQLYHLAKVNIQEVKLWIHRDESIPVKKYTGAMAGASVSNGWFMILTIPAWLITRSRLLKQTEAMEREIRYPEMEWEKMRPYARFPQGMPDEIERGELRGKN